MKKDQISCRILQIFSEIFGFFFFSISQSYSPKTSFLHHNSTRNQLKSDKMSSNVNYSSKIVASKRQTSIDGSITVRDMKINETFFIFLCFHRFLLSCRTLLHLNKLKGIKNIYHKFSAMSVVLCRTKVKGSIRRR